MIRKLCSASFPIHHLSKSDDSRILQQLLESDDALLDAHHAGTTFRFLTALLAFGKEEKILTGSARMQQRPIRSLVDALRTMGAQIEYLDAEGFPPLRISPSKQNKDLKFVHLEAGTSSQFITALMLIAPTLPHGLIIHLEGNVVSRPYIEMTMGVMSRFGVQCIWENQTITIPGHAYTPCEFDVEADWSAASYYYCLAALSKEAELLLTGLHADSLQGDAAITEIGRRFGVMTEFLQEGILLTKDRQSIQAPFFEGDFLPTPDLAQSVCVMMSGLGCQGLLKGLQTLRVKETDRIQALQKELAKVGVSLSKVPARFHAKDQQEMFMQEGKAELQGTVTFQTYDDHRMAMSLACLGILFPVGIEHPAVVSKSYPTFWDDLQSLGFEILETESLVRD